MTRDTSKTSPEYASVFHMADGREFVFVASTISLAIETARTHFQMVAGLYGRVDSVTLTYQGRTVTTLTGEVR